jgi:hypothetical protein
MLHRYHAIEIEDALRATEARPLFPPGSDRADWSQIRNRLGERTANALIANAETYAATPIPSLPATLYLEFMRSGQREGYQNPMWLRRKMLAGLVIGECLEGNGRFLDPVLDVAWAICEESSWAMPAHQHDLADSERPYIDLGAAMTVLELAEADLLLGDQVDVRLGKRIRDEAERRIFTPYLTRHDHWWLHASRSRQVNNWTAVCNGGVAGAAIYLVADPARLAEILARAARSLDDYLDTFDADGGSSEGPGYWDYGFGYYTILADLVERRTGGRIDFLSGERLAAIASYPMRTILSRGQVVNFSDCDADVAYSRAHLTYLARRLDMPPLAKLAMQQPGDSRRDNLNWELRDLMWTPKAETDDHFTPNRHDWFGGMMWMIARYDPTDPAALVLAAKGGHNGEMHNQNDVGNFIVHVNRESVIADVGRGRYTRAYFGPERYEHFVNSSLGHSTPVPNGSLQEAGREYAAELVEHRATVEEDTLLLELRRVYPAVAHLLSLRRQMTLHREAPNGWIEIVDHAVFAGEPGLLESALTTFGKVEVGEGGLVIRGDYGALRVTYDDDLDVRVDLYPEVDLGTAPRDVRRIVFAWREPAQDGEIRLEIVPIDR